ncbi:MAG: hypothetical protein H2056_05250 [Sphingopyxis sp.]|nr:hypothetical protein [Sphingopyxis sp.]
MRLLLGRPLKMRYSQACCAQQPFSSGLRIAPDRMEFWTNAEYRLHDRSVFETADNGEWNRYLLYP